MQKTVIQGKNTSNINPPVAVYARQSIDKKDSISIDTQIEDCINEYKRLGYAGPVFIFSDKGYSGKNTDRPAFREMMNLIENDKIHYVFAYKLDRISRSLYDFTQMQKIFEQHGVDFNSKNDAFDTSTPSGKTMLQIIIVFAELERKNTQQRVTDNYYHRIADSGRWGGGPAPYGFKNAKINGISTLEVVPEEMDVVKYIFDTFYNTPCISLGKMASDLIQKGYKTRKGNFTNVSVGRILRNPIYVKADKLLYNYFETVYFENDDKERVKKYNFLNDESAWDGTHAANIVKKRIANTRERTAKTEHQIYITNVSGIIDSRQYIEIQQKLSANKQFKKSNTLGKLQELTGLLKCAKCGRAIKIYNFPRLSCYGNVALKDCDMKINPANGLTTAEALDDLRIKIGLCVMRYFVQLKRSCLRIEQENKRADKKIAENQKKIDNLVENLANVNPIAADSINKKINELAEEIANIKLDKLMRSKSNLLFEAAKNLKYFNLSPKERQMILREIVDRIEINADYSFKIHWKLKAADSTEDADKLEYLTNGKICIKAEYEHNLTADELEDLIYEAVSNKVQAAEAYCQMNSIKPPRDFFTPYLNHAIIMQNFYKACDDLRVYKSGINNQPDFERKNQAECSDAQSKRHISYRKNDILNCCIEDNSTDELTNNEMLKLAFSLLLPKYKDGDQIDWLANFYDEKYGAVFKFMVI